MNYNLMTWIIGCLIFAIFNFFVEDLEEGEIDKLGGIGVIIIFILLWPVTIIFNIGNIIRKLIRGEYKTTNK